MKNLLLLERTPYNVESKPFGIYKILRITVKSSGKKGLSVPVRLRRGVEKLRLERILFYIIGNFIPIYFGNITPYVRYQFCWS